MLMTKLGQHPLILGKLWIRKHKVIINMRGDKIIFWPGYRNHSDIEKKTPTSEKKLQGITLAPKLNKPIKSQEKTLAQELKKIVLESFSKKNFKRILSCGDVLYTNSGVHKPKEKVPPGAKILGKKPNAKLKQKTTCTKNPKNLPELLLHVLPSAQRYWCISKLVEEPLPKYVVPQRRSTVSPLVSATVGATKLEEKPLQLAMIGVAPFAYLAK